MANHMIRPAKQSWKARKGAGLEWNRQSFTPTYEKRRRETAQKVARFAALLANPEIDGNVTRAAIAMGISQQMGSKYLKRIRDELGWQAQ